MIKVVSKLDKKEYYLATFTGEKADEDIYSRGKYIGRFVEGKKYQVRKATSDDCENPDEYCVVNGLFFDETFLLKPESLQLINRYTGTYHQHAIISKEVVKRHLVYIEKL